MKRKGGEGRGRRGEEMGGRGKEGRDRGGDGRGGVDPKLLLE